MRSPRLATVALALALAGCGSVARFDGVYHPNERVASASDGERVLVRVDRWHWFWGLVDPDPVTVDDYLRRYGPGVRIEGMKIEERRTILGLVLEAVTFGIVSERHFKIVGTPVPERARPD